MLVSFNGLVDGAFAQAENRAREVGTFLTEATQSTVDTVEERFASVRAATGRERERTAAAMRAAYEQANEEMSRLLEEGSKRFAAAVIEMRDMSSDIRRELDATREEVRRGAQEFPQETAEHTGAMRKVVAEQVRALNELTEIVARSGRSYDVAQPTSAGRVETPAAPRRAESVQLPEPMPVRDDFPRARDVAAPPRPTIEARRPVVRPEPQPAPQRREEPRREERRPEPPAPRAAPEPAAPRSQSWLSDLLARASRDEDKDKPRGKASGPADTIEALSLDIARMLDHDAVADHWDRYQRGERAMFERRLYTAQGQQAFEEVRRRYRSEREFRDSVDRYVQEFERLLAEIGRDDRDGSIVKSYLVSDTGKVYTLLAHASQRFE